MPDHESRGVGMPVVRRWLVISTILSLFAVACLAWVTITLTQTSTAQTRSVPGSRITTIPAKPDGACRRGRATLYDECSDQLMIFETAMERAAAENKVLLVSYGAEWCIWCHVFAKYIHGGTTRFEYTYGSPAAPEARHRSTIFERAEQDVTADAAALSAYVGSSLVVVHIDAQYAPNGKAVLEATGAAPFAGDGIPFIFTVDRKGRYAAHVEGNLVEIRRDTDDWYRGYDRRKLLTELQRIYTAVSR